jgi:hypothetical protein
MVKLFLSQYYSEPYVPKAAEDKFHDQTRDEQNELLNQENRLRRRTNETKR